MTKVGDKTIIYDAIGNPENDGTWTYTWEKGRQLASMHNSEKDIQFKYNENGLRVQKTVNGVATNYTLHGKNIVHMTQGSNDLHFFYDAQGKPAIVVFNGTPYSYVKNLQGDIIAILDSSKNVVVKYAYDAWGRPIKKEGSLASTLGTVQPFRFRGYVYDEETGVYYLRSRYYSVEMHRFIIVDSSICHMTGNVEFAPYAYCKNNPVSYADPNGTTESPAFIDNFYNGNKNWSLYDNRRRQPDNLFHEQMFSVTLSGLGGAYGINQDGEMEEKIIPLHISADIATAGWEFEVVDNVEVDLSLFDFCHAELGIEVSEEGVGISAFASMYSPSASISVGNVKIEASAEIGSTGFAVHISKNGFKFSIGGAFGFSFGISW